MHPTTTESQALFERVVTIKTLPAQEEPIRPIDTENAVCGDDDVHPSERTQYKTPMAILDNWASDQKRIFKDNNIPRISIEKSYRKWDSTAHLEIETPRMLLDDGLELHFSVSCNPRYMAQPRDLIPIYLETPRADQAPDKPGNFQLMVVVLQPTWDYNHWEVRVRYSLDQLAKILKLQIGGPVTRNAITDAYREVALRAQWLGVVGQQMPQVNGVRHESGGLDQKGGSGKVRLVPYTLPELAATETRRNTSWNMGEKLNASRPVLAQFGSILQAGKEMMTSLECESEYKMAAESGINDVIGAMQGLLGDTELQKSLGIVKMTGETKKYTDTYFDLPAPCDLLANSVVLRHRHRKTDQEGTYLFALKGATHVDGHGRRLRLAAQVQLATAARETGDGRAKLREFLSDEWVDNPIARTLLHALRNAQQVIARLSTVDIVETLIIESKRETFAMTLDGGTVIDFSADKATGMLPDGSREARVFSFEFGVGHPALTQAATTGPTVSVEGEGEQQEKQKSIKDLIGQFDPPKPQIVRPYHVPADLTNPEVFAREDYKQFVQLRDAVITEVFKLDPHSLELGGNKAHDLARMLGLIT